MSGFWDATPQQIDPGARPQAQHDDGVPSWVNGTDDPGYWAGLAGEADDSRARDEQAGTADRSSVPPTKRLFSASEFMDQFQPPDYVIDGIIQCGKLYALTSPTGHGKTAVALYAAFMVGAGRHLGHIEVK